MAKRIALLLSLVMMLSFSCVFATELTSGEASDEKSTEVVLSGEVATSGEEDVSGDETVSGDVVDTDVSGEVEAPVSGEETEDPANNTDAPSTTDDEEENSSVLAAVIAIVVVVAIVAIVCVLKKK